MPLWVSALIEAVGFELIDPARGGRLSSLGRRYYILYVWSAVITGHTVGCQYGREGFGTLIELIARWGAVAYTWRHWP